MAWPGLVVNEYYDQMVVGVYDYRMDCLLMWGHLVEQHSLKIQLTLGWKTCFPHCQALIMTSVRVEDIQLFTKRLDGRTL